MSVAPSSQNVLIGAAQNFTAVVANDSQSKGVTWTVSGSGCVGATCGSLSTTSSPSGTPITYNAPPSVPNPPTVTLTATSVADTSKSGTATITVISSTPSLVSVTTWHNDNLRSGVNSQETILTPTSINSTTKFGKKFSCAVDADVYAQPLYVPNVSITSKGTHNVIFVATEKNSVYAFDGDSNSSPCVALWNVPLMNSGETSLDTTSGDGCTETVSPDIGITGTPVIDPSAQTLYVVSTSKVTAPSLTYFQRLHALSLADGSEKFGGPITIQGSVPGTGGTVAFDPKQHLQRPALLLQGGAVYVAWASYCDLDPYHGWVIGFSASGGTLQRTSILNATPNGSRGGIWMSGAGPAADASGNIFLITGNGTFDATSGTPPNNDYGDSFLKLTGTLSVNDWFTPSNEASLNTLDLDVGGGGAVLLIDNPGGANAHLLIGGGKEGKLYLLNRDNLGHLVSGDSQIVQSFSPLAGHGIFASPVFWQGRLYIAAANSPLQAFAFNTATGTFNATPVNSTSTVFRSVFEAGGATPSISASPTGTNSIVWAIEWTPGSAAVLHAYDASNLTELWNSSQNAARDQAGPAVKFTVPTIANGKVYIGAHSELDVYGLLP